jgi:hypothetical protein
MWSSSYFAKFVLMERRRPPKIIFQLDVVHNLPTELPQKSWMKNHFFHPPEAFTVIQTPHIGAFGSTRLNFGKH